MYSLRVQYYIGDVLTTDISTHDQLWQVNAKIMDLIEPPSEKKIQAIRVVHESGKY